ncbi:hypothetical protein ES703_29030 [subsurface metagenome]
MKLQNRVIPGKDVQKIGDVYPVPDDSNILKVFPDLPTYDYKAIAAKYAYVEVTDKPKARQIRADSNPILEFIDTIPTFVTLSTGETIRI